MRIRRIESKQQNIDPSPCWLPITHSSQNASIKPVSGTCAFMRTCVTDCLCGKRLVLSQCFSVNYKIFKFKYTKYILLHTNILILKILRKDEEKTLQQWLNVAQLQLPQMNQDESFVFWKVFLTSTDFCVANTVASGTNACQRVMQWHHMWGEKATKPGSLLLPSWCFENCKAKCCSFLKRIKPFTQHWLVPCASSCEENLEQSTQIKAS